MPVSKEITQLEKSSVKMSLTIPKEDVQAQYQDLLKDYSKNVQLPGFRKGHAPQEVLIRKFGEALKGEALGKIIEKAVDEVFQDESLSRHERPLPYAQPRMEEEPKLDFDQDLKFSLIYDVLPKLTIDQWKGFTVEVPQVEITEEDISRELEDVRERNSVILDCDDDAQAQNENVVTISYCEIDEHGEELPNSRRDDYAFALGSGVNAYQIDDDIIGMKKGETKEVTKTYPENKEGEEKQLLAGKTLTLRITLNNLKEKKLPDLDDELAQDVDEKFQTLDDLKASIQERLEKNLEHRLRDEKVNKILEKIMEKTPTTLPESMIKIEIEGHLRRLARQFGTDTEKLRQMFAISSNGVDDIEEKWRPSTEKALHSRLIVETIMEEQHITANDDELDAEIDRIAAETGQSAEDVEMQYQEHNGMDYLAENIKERKLFDLLLAENTVNTGAQVKYLDFIDKNE